MIKLWEETEIEDGSLKRTAFVRGGLMIVYELDEDFCAWPTGFEIWHRLSLECILVADAVLERAIEIADDLSAIADWQQMCNIEDPMIQLRILAFASSQGGEVSAGTSRLWGLDGIIPYGENSVP